MEINTQYWSAVLGECNTAQNGLFDVPVSYRKKYSKKVHEGKLHYVVADTFGDFYKVDDKALEANKLSFFPLQRMIEELFLHSHEAVIFGIVVEKGEFIPLFTMANRGRGRGENQYEIHFQCIRNQKETDTPFGEKLIYRLKTNEHKGNEELLSLVTHLGITLRKVRKVTRNIKVVVPDLTDKETIFKELHKDYGIEVAVRLHSVTENARLLLQMVIQSVSSALKERIPYIMKVIKESDMRIVVTNDKSRPSWASSYSAILNTMYLHIPETPCNTQGNNIQTTVHGLLIYLVASNLASIAETLTLNKGEKHISNFMSKEYLKEIKDNIKTTSSPLPLLQGEKLTKQDVDFLANPKSVYARMVGYLILSEYRNIKTTMLASTVEEALENKVVLEYTSLNKIKSEIVSAYALAGREAAFSNKGGFVHV